MRIERYIVAKYYDNFKDGRPAISQMTTLLANRDDAIAKAKELAIECRHTMIVLGVYDVIEVASKIKHTVEVEES